MEKPSDHFQIIHEGHHEYTDRGGVTIGPFKVDYGYMGLMAYPLVKAPGLEGSYVASGNGGQIIWFFPKLDMALILTGSNFNSSLGQTQPIDIVMNHIYPALK